MKRATPKNERFVVERRGEPSVIIMSVKDYVDTIAASPTWLKHIQAESKRKGLDKLQMRDINRLVAVVRRNARRARPSNRHGK